MLGGSKRRPLARCCLPTSELAGTCGEGKRRDVPAYMYIWALGGLPARIGDMHVGSARLAPNFCPAIMHDYYGSNYQRRSLNTPSLNFVACFLVVVLLGTNVDKKLRVDHWRS